MSRSDHAEVLQFYRLWYISTTASAAFSCTNRSKIINDMATRALLEEESSRPLDCCYFGVMLLNLLEFANKSEIIQSLCAIRISQTN